MTQIWWPAAPVLQTYTGCMRDMYENISFERQHVYTKVIVGVTFRLLKHFCLSRICRNISVNISASDTLYTQEIVVALRVVEHTDK